MKRYVAKVVLLLLAAVGLNIATVMLCALVDIPGFAIPLDDPANGRDHWLWPAPSDWPTTVSSYGGSVGLGHRSARAFNAITKRVADMFNAATPHEQQSDEYGLPFTAMRARLWYGQRTQKYFPLDGFFGFGVEYSWPDGFQFIGAISERPTTPWLPLRILPIGFALDSAFWAAALYLGITIPRRAIRYSRLRRGLCRACTYPMRTSPVCTECGTPVPPKPQPSPRA